MTSTPLTDLAADPETTLARWRADEAARRARMTGPGIAGHADVRHMSGMELFEAMFDGRLPWAPIGGTLGFLPVHIEPGRAVFQGKPSFDHYNPLGTVHGGWFATLLDSCVACAVHSTLPAGKAYTTIELKINLVRALTDKVPLVRAEGLIVHPGNQVATAEGRLYGPDGKLYAHATTTCLVFDAKPRAAAA